MKNKPVILAIETSSRLGSVALGFGDEILAETLFSGFMKHSSEVFPSIQGLLNQFGLKPDNIEQLYISNGPGSFTGLRIAVSLAKIMYLANSIKIAAVDSLDVVAFNAIEAINDSHIKAGLSDNTSGKEIEINRVAAILDAKRGQFFVSEYNVVRTGNDLSIVKVMDDSIMNARQFREKTIKDGNPVWLLGDGLLYYRQEFQDENIKFLEEKYWSPRASSVYKIGREMAKNNKFNDPIALKPNYLYRPEIKVKLR